MSCRLLSFEAPSDNLLLCCSAALECWLLACGWVLWAPRVWGLLGHPHTMRLSVHGGVLSQACVLGAWNMEKATVCLTSVLLRCFGKLD